MEAVIFVGGVSLGQPATSIPIAAIVGLVCGLVCGYLIYAFASRTSTYPQAGRYLVSVPGEADGRNSAALTVFMVVMTNFLILIGAGLFSKAVWSLQENAFNHL